VSFSRIEVKDHKSTCPWCKTISNHITGHSCKHLYKVTVKGIAFYTKPQNCYSCSEFIHTAGGRNIPWCLKLNRETNGLAPVCTETD
jgi:hypothetical protein